MAKKTKDAAATAKKAPKAPKAPPDPVKTRNLVHLLNILSLLLAIAAFLLQFFAVVTHHWKRQVTDLHPIVSPDYHYAEPLIHEDSRVDQNFGLFDRDVKLYAKNDEAMDARTSTRFPMLDGTEGQLQECLTKPNSLRGAFLTCADGVASSDQCHCRRYTYWKVIIVFEILALVLLGIVVFLCALLTTQFHNLIKPIALGLSFLAFLLMLIGLILLASHLRRETRWFADAYPFLRQRLVEKLDSGARRYQRDSQRVKAVFRRDLSRHIRETYRIYPLVPGQYPYNDTHFQQYSDTEQRWIHIPYSSLGVAAPDTDFPTESRPVELRPVETRPVETRPVDPRPVVVVNPPYVPLPATTSRTVYNQYGPLLGHDRAMEHTRAWISWSAILSLLALILALLVPLLLVVSWLMGKKLGPDVKTVTTTSVKTEYVTIPHDASTETVPLQQGYSDVEYDPNRPVASNIGATTQHVSYINNDPVIVRDVIIRGDQSVASAYPRQQYQS